MLRRLLRDGDNIGLSYSRIKVGCTRLYSSEDYEREKEFERRLVPREHPFTRTVNCLKRDFRRVKNKVMFWKSFNNNAKQLSPEEEWGEKSDKIFPSHCDIVIIGGGAIGSSIAYWLKTRSADGLNVVVVEKDPTYSKASTSLSVGGLRQQFSLEENIRMSLFGAEFIREINDYLGIEGEPRLDAQFHPHGYLFLASEEGAETLEQNSSLQVSLGARNVLLSPKLLKDKLPWLNTEGIALGCLGLEQEGWFDPWALLYGLKRKSISLGAEYINAEAKGFLFRRMHDAYISGSGSDIYQSLDKLVVETADGQLREIKFAICIIASGAFSANVAEMARIGTGKGLLAIPLPVEPRKRYVYCFNCPEGPGLNTPLTIDPSGTYFRREGLGHNYICGRSPELEEEPPTDNLDVDDNFFNEKIWPILAHRVPAFQKLKLKNSWAGYYEYNTFDENGIVGPHPSYHNLYLATGFSGHGIQHAPAVGRAITELILDASFSTIDLTKLSFDRLITLQPAREINVV